MQNRLVFLTSGHSPTDDRIYYNMADSLVNFQPVIVSGLCDFFETKNNITIHSFDGKGLQLSSKLDRFIEILTIYQPEIIICSEPVPILAAKKFKKLQNKKAIIIYDITEWYTGRINTDGLNFISKLIKKMMLSALNIYASSFVDAFIFGEHYKSILYRCLFPFKRWEKISYFPNLKYINYTLSNPINEELCLGYTGRLNKEKGLGYFINAVKEIQIINPQIKLRLKFIGWFIDENEKISFYQQISCLNNVNIEFTGHVPFLQFSESLKDIHVLFDLRQKNFENNYSLPIKLFYYAACGKPVIYTNLKAIRKELHINSFGTLTNPGDANKISKQIMSYIEDAGLYKSRCLNARKFAEERYNWDIISPKLINFVTLLLKDQKK